MVTKCILADWGTSSLRIWGMGRADEVTFEHRSQSGMSKLKPNDFGCVLERVLHHENIGDNIPVLICGMAGAAQGWQDAGYLDVPTNLDKLPKYAVQVNSTMRDVRILPGIAQKTGNAPDVMRGEETLLLGALVCEKSYETYCLPGTHSKWVSVTEGVVEHFQTFMTGELFALLSEHSTLSFFLNSHPVNLQEDPAFRTAVLEINACPDVLTNLMFSIRSGALLFPKYEEKHWTAKLSGLLIGAELTGAVSQNMGKIGLISDQGLSELYASAMRILNISFDEIDSRELALHGLKFSAKQIWPEPDLE